MSRSGARWSIIVAAGAILGLAAALTWNWRAWSPWVGEYEGLFRVLGTVLAPILALLGFLWSRIDKERLREQAEALGIAREAARRAEDDAGNRKSALDRAEVELMERENRIAELEADIVRITENASQIWRIRPPRVFDSYYEWRARKGGARIIIVGNLKGGVGKTTLAANLAAYISETRRKPVLVIDLDYQASLSNSLMLAAGLEEVESHLDWLLAPEATFLTLDRARVHLANVLPRAWLVPSGYTLNEVENRLLLQSILATDQIDPRYRLARLLMQPEVRDSYEAIILDMPPRMTLGAVNGLVAADALVVPTVLDKLSAEAVGQFLAQMTAIKADMGLDLELAGIVPTMTRRHGTLSARERQAMELARDDARRHFPRLADEVFTPDLPYRASIASAAGEGIAYFGKDSQGRPLRELFDPIYEQLLTRIGIETTSSKEEAAFKTAAK